MTLDDVHCILRLPIWGETIHIEEDCTHKKMWQDIEYCVGHPIRPRDIEALIELQWLLYMHSLLLQRIMVVTMALALVPNGQGTHLDGGLIHTIRKMECHWTVYSWGLLA